MSFDPEVMLEGNTMNIDAIHKALANPTRRQILAWLKDPEQFFPTQSHPFSNGVCAGQIDQRVGLSQSTVSAHLAILLKAGLITSQRVGQWNYFQRDEATIRAFIDQMTL